MDIGSAALVVIDMQNGFVNHHSRHVVPAVSDLVAQWSAAGRPVIFTRYFNYPNSPYERFFQWHRLQEPPETDLVPELTETAARAHAVIDKTRYTLFTAEATEMIRQTGWTDLIFCGIATESCVLKSATDAFEHGYAPWIATDACASDSKPRRSRRRARRRPPTDRNWPTCLQRTCGGTAHCVRRGRGAGIAPWSTHRPAPVHPPSTTRT